MISTTRAGVLAAAAVILVAGCAQQRAPAPAVPAVTVAPAVARNVADWDEFTGRFDAVEAVEVRPRISGYIDHVAFHEGAIVRAGEVLFVIDQRPYAAALAGAEADLAKAKASEALARTLAERVRPLAATHAISQDEIESREGALTEATASVKAAEAAVATARLNMAWTEVRSPITGRVSRAEVTAGNLVQASNPATLLTTVVSIDPIYVYFDGDEQAYLKHDVQSGRDQVFVGLASEDGYPHQGTVDFIDNRLASATGTIRVRAVLQNHDGRFTPGLFARVKVVETQPFAATLIEDRAVGTDQDKKFVYVLTPDTTIAYREVHLGRLVDGQRVVTSGVKPGEYIVVNGLQRVRPGSKVKPLPEPTGTDTTTNQRTALATH
jgi:RND family efflux transporter MFP subunit